MNFVILTSTIFDTDEQYLIFFFLTFLGLPMRLKSYDLLYWQLLPTLYGLCELEPEGATLQLSAVS